MGLTKQYLRHAAAGMFNVIGSANANVLFIALDGVTVSRTCAVAACEHVFIWDLRKGEKVATLRGDKHNVTALAASPDRQHLAVGYSDGTVRVFELRTGESNVTFSGHKSAITALNYDNDGMRLVSGSRDTDVIVWDIVSEAGLFRLRGHKGEVTQCRFLTCRNVLITSSKDTFVKFWDLDTQHCFKTLVGHRTEVWDFVIVKGETYLITGSGDMELRVWNMSYNQQETKREDVKEAKRRKLDSDSDGSEAEDDDDDSSILSCTLHGSLRRRGRGRVVAINLDPSRRIIGCVGIDSHLELFRLEATIDVEKRVRKKCKKALKLAREAGDEEAGVSVVQTLEDEITRLTTVKMAAKIHSFDVCRHDDDDNVVKVLSLLANNSLQLCEVDSQQTKPEATNVCQLSLPGHRTDVRTLAFSSDNTAILSASGDTVKVWNRSSLNCIRTMTCDYALTSLFAPGDRHVIVGTKSGKLQIFDVAAGTLLETIDAHQGAVWSVSLSPDKRGIASGSGDHDVKFWDFELVTDTEYSATRKRLTLVHTRTLKMAEDVLCVKFSPDQKLLAVALLDSTVKVFYADTLKFFLSLYGHKLPVLSLDISTDGTLLASGSGDRNVKLWGLDFGDCHKSIFAHDDSVMCVQFVPKTHMFFTCGRDGKVKQWDADCYERILTLEGHKAEVWSLAISPSGNFVVSSSHDKSLRLWEKTEEALVLDDEKEMEREKQYEDAIADGDQPVIAGETDKETGMAGKKTVATVRAAERIMEAIELYKEESAKLAQHEAECKAAGKQLPPPPVHPMMQAHSVTSPTNYVLEVIKRVKSSELEEALLVLPFPYVTDLLRLLHVFIERGWEVELICRCILFLLRIHQGQITSNQVLLSVIDKLRISTTTCVSEQRDMVGFNLAALNFVKQHLEEKEEVMFFADATQRFREKKKKAKKRALLTMK